MRRLIAFFLLLTGCAIQQAKAQQNQSFNLETFVEALLNQQEQNINYEDLYESLLLLYQNPLDLNRASPEELQNLYVLSISQITNLLTYISEKGKLLTLFELQLIDGFDPVTIQKLLPFIKVDLQDAIADKRPLHQRILEAPNNYLISRYERVLEIKKGYTPALDSQETRYAGSPDKLYFRYRVSRSQDFSLGFTTEKDPGEALVWDNSTKRRGMDFWSAHFMLEKQGKFRKAIIGDYQLQFGQGLLFGAGIGVGKGSETINSVQRVSLGIKPYTSVLEGGFLRGVAGTYEVSNRLNLTGFYSRLNQDANIRQDDASEFQESFSSFQLSGFHRTPTEIENKRAVTETVWGINTQYSFNTGAMAGLTITGNRFSTPMLRSDAPYNEFEFQGTVHYNLGIYGSYRWRNISLFAEAAISKSGGFGLIAGFTGNISPRVDLAMVLRNYNRDFHSFRGTAFAEGSRNINERGVYWGLKYTYNRQFYLTAYYDTFYFPWLKFRVNTPSQGNDSLLRLHYNPNRSVRLYGQWRREIKEVNSLNNETNQTIVTAGKKTQLLINLEFSANSNLRLKSRFQYSNYQINGKQSSGYAFIQDAVYTMVRWTFSARMALFDTEGNENRQYAYERDALYAFSIPAYSGRGIRNYLLIQCRLSRKTDIWARIARNTFYDRDEIGTGLETIEGNKRTEVKLQLRYKLK